jgi:hypothetical protein
LAGLIQPENNQPELTWLGFVLPEKNQLDHPKKTIQRPESPISQTNKQSNGPTTKGSQSNKQPTGTYQQKKITQKKMVPPTNNKTTTKWKQQRKTIPNQQSTGKPDRRQKRYHQPTIGRQ